MKHDYFFHTKQLTMPIEFHNKYQEGEIESSFSPTEQNTRTIVSSLKNPQLHPILNKFNIQKSSFEKFIELPHFTMIHCSGVRCMHVCVCVHNWYSSKAVKLLLLSC